MATATWSGYQAEIQAGLSTELNSLADNGFSALSTEIDNSTNKYLFADMEVYLASLTAGTTGDEAVEIYVVPTVDGTNYPDWTTGTADAQENNIHFVGSVPIDQSGPATKRGVLRAVALPPGKFKLAVRNRCNVAMAASGSTVKYRPYGYSAA